MEGFHWFNCFSIIYSFHCLSYFIDSFHWFLRSIDWFISLIDWFHWFLHSARYSIGTVFAGSCTSQRWLDTRRFDTRRFDTRRFDTKGSTREGLVSARCPRRRRRQSRVRLTAQADECACVLQTSKVLFLINKSSSPSSWERLLPTYRPLTSSTSNGGRGQVKRVRDETFFQRATPWPRAPAMELGDR